MKNRLLKVTHSNGGWSFTWEQWNDEQVCYDKRSLSVPAEIIALQDNGLDDLLQEMIEVADEICGRSFNGLVTNVIGYYKDDNLSISVKISVPLLWGGIWNVSTPKMATYTDDYDESKKLSAPSIKKFRDLENKCFEFLGIGGEKYEDKEKDS